MFSGVAAPGGMEKSPRRVLDLLKTIISDVPMRMVRLMRVLAQAGCPEGSGGMSWGPALAGLPGLPGLSRHYRKNLGGYTGRRL